MWRGHAPPACLIACAWRVWQWAHRERGVRTRKAWLGLGLGRFLLAAGGDTAGRLRQPLLYLLHRTAPSHISTLHAPHPPPCLQGYEYQSGVPQLCCAPPPRARSPRPLGTLDSGFERRSYRLYIDVDCTYVNDNLPAFTADTRDALALTFQVWACVGVLGAPVGGTFFPER